MERRQLALMFTDIVGYSKLMGADEPLTIELLGEYRRILLAKIEDNHGRVVQFIGDAVFACFDTAREAVNAGVAIQKALARYNIDAEPDRPPLQSRIGIHLGEVSLKDDTLLGDDVNIAARLEPLAVADGICISETVYQAVKDEITDPVKKLGVQPLKNIDSKVTVYLVRPGGIGLRTHVHYFMRKTRQKFGAYRYPIAACLLALIAASFYFIPLWLVPGYSANYVEIADFRNLSSESEEPDYFSAGVTEALRSQLADIHDVYILEADKGVRAPVRLEGSIQKAGENIRIAYRLFRREDNVQIAGGKLDGLYQDIFILQDRIVAEIASYLAKEFELDNFRPAAVKITSDITAYDYYMQGLEYLGKPRSQENYDAAIKLMSTALVHDKKFAGASVGICRAYRGKFELSKVTSLLQRAEEHCLDALALDDSDAHAHIALGMIYRDKGDYQKAKKTLDIASKLDRNNADLAMVQASVYQATNKLDLAESTFLDAIANNPRNVLIAGEYASFLIETGRIKDAIGILENSLAILPDNEPQLSNLGVAYFYLGKYRQSADAFEKAVNIVPTGTGFANSGSVYYFAGEYEKAIDMYRKAIRLSPTDYRLYVYLADSLRMLPGRKPEALDEYRKAVKLGSEHLGINENNAHVYQHLAIAYLYLGNHEQGKACIEKALSLRPEDMDILYMGLRFWVGLGDYETALPLLEKVLASGYPMHLIDADPELKELRNHDEYQQVVLTQTQE